jgi:actin-like ATPase involved in cell morphogenesis
MKTIGIDLGTTNSCVYYLDGEDTPVPVTDRLGRKIFPSAVWCAGPGKEVVVGHAAKSRLGQQPPPIVAVKRKIGTTEMVDLGGQSVSPVAVSAHILGFLKSLVEETTGDRVGAAVVTVPAYFDAAPKKDTYLAAVEGLFGGNAALARGRLELQLEPEAAAFAYTLEDPAERLRILAYDLGGGTFDVTVLEKSPAGGLAVLKFGGDPHLGGDNVDDRVAAWMLYLLRGGRPEALERILDPARYPEEEQYTLLQQLLTDDVAALRTQLRPEDQELRIGVRPGYALALDAAQPADLPRIQKLKLLAEKAKMDLTVVAETPVVQQGAFADQEGNLVDVDLSLDRVTFNRLIGDFVRRTMEETARVLAASGLARQDLDRIVLVGGSTRMPVIREELEKRYACPVLVADPDLIVARGAAWKARQLSLSVADGAPGMAKLQLEYPRKTSDEQVQVKGRVTRPLADHRAYLSRGGEELAEAPIAGDRFLFERVPLTPDAPNPLHLEVADAAGDLFAEADFTIVHDARAPGGGDHLASRLAKPILAEGIRGRTVLLPEGEPLPARASTPGSRGTSEDRIVIPLYEGERWLTNLVITGVDPSLPEGALIDLQLSVDKDFSCSATAMVRDTRQAASVEFEISRIEIPAGEDLDRMLDDAMEEFDNDIKAVRDREHRARLAQRARRLKAGYHKARRELTPDRHHLYTLVAQLRTLLIEVRGSQDRLDPPREDFDRLLGAARRLAGRLDEGAAFTRDEAVAKLAALERAGGEAWERQDAALWRSVNAELGRLRQDLDRVLLPPPPDPRQLPPERVQAGLLGWLGELREKVEDAGVVVSFAGQLEEVERAIRQVDLRRRDAARDALLDLASERLNPLDHRVARAIRERGGKTAADGSTGAANVHFKP